MNKTKIFKNIILILFLINPLIYTTYTQDPILLKKITFIFSVYLLCIYYFNKKNYIRFNTIHILLVSFLLYTFLRTVLFPPYIKYDLLFNQLHLIAVILFIILIYQLRLGLYKVIHILFYYTIVLFLVGIYGFLQTFGIDFHQWSVQFMGSTLGNPNFVAQMMLPNLIISVILFIDYKRKWNYYVYYITNILLSLYLINYSQSRAVIIALIVFAVLSITYYLSKQKKIIGILFLCIALLTGFIYIKNYLTDFYITSDNSIFVRSKLYVDSMNICRDNPVFGIGYGEFNYIHSKYRNILERELSSSQAAGYVHSDIIQYLVESGIIGYGILILILFLMFRYRHKDIYLLSLTAIALLVNSFFSFSLHNPNPLYTFAFVSGILISYTKLKEYRINIYNMKFKKHIMIIITVLCVLNSLFLIKLIYSQRHFKLGAREMKQKKYSSALYHLLKSYNSYKYNGNVISRIGNLYYNQKNSQAIDYFIQSLDFVPYEDKMHYNIGVIRYENRQIMKAIKRFYNALEIYPLHKKAKNKLAQCYEYLGVQSEQKGRYLLSLRFFNIGLKYNPEYPSLYYNLGITWFRLNNIKNAEKAILHSYKYKKDYNYLKTLGLMFGQKENYVKALEYWQKAYKLNPDDEELAENILKARKLINKK